MSEELIAKIEMRYDATPDDLRFLIDRLSEAPYTLEYNHRPDLDENEGDFYLVVENEDN